MFTRPMTFRFIEDHIHENGWTESSEIDKITSLFFTGGVYCPKDSTLKIPGLWVGAFDVSEPDDFSLHRRPYVYVYIKMVGSDLPN